MYKRTLNDFYEVDGNTLISNNYNAFDTDVLEIRIQTLYGERPLRHFADSRIKIMAQNVVNMYSGYLTELFTFPTEYKILTPEVKEIVRDMAYNLTHEDTSIGVNKGNSSETGSGTTNDTERNVLNSISKLIHGLNIESNRNINNKEWRNDEYNDTKKNTGTSTTDIGRANNNTDTKSVSAYNQMEGFSPRDQTVSNGTNTEDATTTNDLTETLNHSGAYGSNSDTVDTDSESHTGTDTTDIDSTTDITKNGQSTSQKTSNSLMDTTEDSHGTEEYSLNENIKETGRLSYEEIINTIENLFNPYDWLARKIVNTICEVFYYERIKT